jgi:putative MATE family efflux protein
MYFIGISCVTNITLDYVFIGLCDLGPSGAALGTVLSQTFSVIVAFISIRKRKTGIKLVKEDFIPDRKVLGEILKVGIPVAVQDGCIQVAFIIITVIANHRGLDDAAAVGIVEKMISAIFIIPSSMLATVSALSAQNIGAGKYDRAAKTLKYATMITSVYGVFMAVIMQVLAAPLLALFTKDAAVVVLGTQYMKGYIIDSIFAGVHFCFSGYFAAYGKSYIGFMHNIISITFVRVPGSYLASKLFGDTLFPMGLAAPAGSLLSVIICVCAYIYLKRSGKLEPVAA